MAVVVVPKDEDLKTRKKSKKINYKQRLNFTLPADGTAFDDIQFAELPRAEAEQLLKKYKEDAPSEIEKQKKEEKSSSFKKATYSSSFSTFKKFSRGGWRGGRGGFRGRGGFGRGFVGGRGAGFGGGRGVGPGFVPLPFRGAGGGFPSKNISQTIGGGFPSSGPFGRDVRVNQQFKAVNQQFKGFQPGGGGSNSGFPSGPFGQRDIRDVRAMRLLNETRNQSPTSSSSSHNPRAISIYDHPQTQSHLPASLRGGDGHRDVRTLGGESDIRGFSTSQIRIFPPQDERYRRSQTSSSSRIKQSRDLSPPPRYSSHPPPHHLPPPSMGGLSDDGNGMYPPFNPYSRYS